ncbi:SCO family protein [Qipengyuania sp. MTN3-11]|uniref:SCO family protein n=1 Tax=Qipengyuania sp. MTN3-11 TaxID=3056557 RepID=UPI0036F3A6B6
MLRFFAPLALSLSIAACGPSAPADPPPLEGAALGGDFTLTGEDGNQVSWNDFAGQYRTIYFGYAFCPDVCPTDNQRAMAGLRQFAEEHPDRAAKVQPLFVSVDPDRDTPEVLTQFTDAFHPRLIGMTGSPDDLEATAKEFGASFSVPPPEERGEAGYLVGHSNLTLLFGPDGKPLATLPTDLGPQAVAAELEKWVR